MQLNLFCAVSVQTFFSKIGTSLLLYVVSSLLRQLLASQLVVLTHHLHLPDGFLSELFRNFLWTDFTHFGRFWSTNISLKSRIRMLAISGSGPHPSSTHVWTVSKLSWSCWSCWSRQAFESTKSNPRNFPVGPREPLKLSPDRWELPLHLLQPFVQTQNSASTSALSACHEARMFSQFQR